jgi:branched-chain amino acid transport system substrate-binding protein
VDEFQAQYAASHGGAPATSEVAYHYQNLALYVEAMEVAGSTDDPKAIQEALPEALESLEDKFKVSEFPTTVSDNGHLLSDDLQAIFYNGEDDYELFPVPAPQE